MPADKIGKFQIIGRIGRDYGGVVRTYKALHPDLNRVVTVEVFDRAAHRRDAWQRVLREKRALAALHHPNILQVFDLTTVDGALLVVSEYVEGETLSQRLARLQREGRQMSLRRALFTVAALGHAVHYAHEQGVRFCALNPDNVMLRDDGQVTLTGLGGECPPAWRSPEDWSGGEPDARSDVYALGVMLFHLATGQPPFDAQTEGQWRNAHLSASPPSPRRLRDDIPPALEGVMLRALSKDPRERYQSASEMVDDLRAAGQEMKGRRPSLATAPPVAPSSGGRWRWFGLGALAGLLLALGAFVALGRLGGPPPAPDPTPDLAGTALAARVVALEATLSVSPTPVPPSDTPVPPTPTPTPTVKPSPTPTPSPTASPTPCVYSLALVEDINYNGPGWGAVVGAPFEKTWLVRNDGSCAWPPGVALAHLDGADLGLATPVAVEPLVPDWDAELSVTLRAPAVPGFYESRFQVQTADGSPIGEPLSVALQVRPLATPAPTPSGTPEPTAGAVEPVHIVGWELVDWQDDAGNNVWRGTLRLWAEGGDGRYTWYRDTLDQPLPGDTLTFEWRRCANFFGSAWVMSASTMDHVSLFVAFPGDCE